MPPRPALSHALQDQRLFRAGQPLAHGKDATPSGFAALDDVLPWGGFPRGALTEVLLPHPGVGEISLIAAAWSHIGMQENTVFVTPAGLIPYAPALHAAGVSLARFAWIETTDAKAPWAAEQCLRSGCTGAVAVWLSGADDRVLRRLQLAAAEGRCHGFVFRPARHAANPSPCALRLQLEPTSGSLRLRVIKCRGALIPGAPLNFERKA